MSQQDDEFESAEGSSRDFVPAVFARSVEEAERYQELLDDHDIPALIGENSGGMARGVPVMVPEVYLDEASEIIADREELEEFDILDGDLEDEEDEDEEFSGTEGFKADEDDEPLEDDELFEDKDEDDEELDEDDDEF